MDQIEVVAGIYVRNRRILLQQRPPTKDFPFSWECPGGKRNLEDGCESRHDTLRREWKEELDLRVGAMSTHVVASTQFQKGEMGMTRAVHLVFFHVWEAFGTLRPLEEQGFGWFTSEEMIRLQLTPGNARMFERIAEFVV